ncbi:MAG: uroporphyrinogen-III synthase [Pseudomonadota bacterium]
MTRILLTRPQEDSKVLAQQIMKLGAETVICPMMNIVPSAQNLPNLNAYDALAFTSANGIRVFSKLSDQRNFDVYCVGPASADLAREKGFRSVHEASGSAKTLADLIVQEKPRRVLYGAPVDQAFDLASALQEKGIDCDEHTLYAAQARGQLPREIMKMINTGQIEYALFYSKRTARIFMDLAHEAGCTPALKSIKALCLSDSVIQSQDIDIWKRTRVSRKPDSASLLKLLKNCLKEEKMSKSNNKNIENASAIIERFGGIRPMASKIDVPVTTVQGWKKRDVIPAARRTLIMEAANVNNIDLSDILGSSDNNVAQFSKAPESKPAQETANDIDKTEIKGESKKERYESLEGIQSSDDIWAEIEASEKKAVRNSVWASAGLIGLVIVGGAFLLWPSANTVTERLSAHGEQIEVLEEDVAVLDETVRDTSARTGFLDGVVPEDLQGRLEGLQNQAANLQNTFSQLDEKTRDIREGVLAPDAGNLSERMAVLETQVAELTGSAEFAGLIARVRSLEETLAGQEQLSMAVEELQTIVDGIDGKVSSIDERLQSARDGEGPLGETLQGVSSNDLKAAAMLIAFSQLRDSLNREAPFEDDLILLQKMVSEDNVELQDALTKLAPHADGGVLTTQGLSGEFRGLAGDIVVASLSGEDVSITDRAKARLSDIMTVEKDGEVVGGTDTQAAVSRAQTLLDEGDVQGAIAILQTLEGPAADQAQPFIEQAEISMLAEQVQTMLRQNILSRVSGVFPAGMMGGQPLPNIITPSGSGTLNLDQITDTIKSVVPNQQVVTDEESGVSILPQQQGFRGLSDR